MQTLLTPPAPSSPAPRVPGYLSDWPAGPLTTLSLPSSRPFSPFCGSCFKSNQPTLSDIVGDLKGAEKTRWSATFNHKAWRFGADIPPTMLPHFT